MKLINPLWVLFIFFISTAAYASLPVTLTAPSIDSSLSVGDSKSYTYTLNNQSGSALPVLAIEITGNSTAARLASTCTEIPARGSCSFVVTVTPAVSDMANGIQDTLNITYQGRLPHPQITSPINVSINYNEPALTLTAPSLPSVMMVGDTKDYVYTLTNTANVAMPISSLDISGNSSSAQISSTCSEVPANGSCAFTVKISPAESDATDGIQATINIAYQGLLSHPPLTSPIRISVKMPEKVKASLSGPAPLLANKQVSGTSQTVTYTFSNKALTRRITSFNLTGLSGHVTQTNNCTVPIAPSTHCTIQVTLAPEAEDIGKLSQTFTITFGGDSPLKANIDVTVTNPVLIASGIANDNSYHVYASNDLGQHWSNISKKINQANALAPINSIAGGATFEKTNHQLLNDTIVIAAGNGANGAGYFLTSNSDQWQHSQLTSATNVPNVIAYGLQENTTPYFFSGLLNDGNTSFGYSSNAGLDMFVNNSSVSDTTPSAAAFGGGYYLLGLTSTLSSFPGHIVYTADPTETKERWTASGPLPDVITSTIAGIAYANINNKPTWVTVAGTSAYQTTDITSFKPWTKTNAFTHTTVGVIYNALIKAFVAIDIEGNYYTSLDGITWSNPTAIAAFAAHAITFSHSTGTMVVVGSDNKIYYSNGKTVDWHLASVDVDLPVTFTAVAASTV